MADSQNLTKTSGALEIKAMPVPWEELDPRQQTLVDFKALNGLIISDEERMGGKNSDVALGLKMRKMTHDELAKALGLADRRTLYDWINVIPNFWDLVKDRRKILFSQTRLARVHEVWYLKVLEGSWPHMEAYLRNFDDTFIDPKAKEKPPEDDNMTDLLNKARARRAEAGEIVEGEIV